MSISEILSFPTFRQTLIENRKKANEKKIKEFKKFFEAYYSKSVDLIKRNLKDVSKKPNYWAVSITIEVDNWESDDGRINKYGNDLDCILNHDFRSFPEAVLTELYCKFVLKTKVKIYPTSKKDRLRLEISL